MCFHLDIVPNIGKYLKLHTQLQKSSNEKELEISPNSTWHHYVSRSMSNITSTRIDNHCLVNIYETIKYRNRILISHNQSQEANYLVLHWIVNTISNRVGYLNSIPCIASGKLSLLRWTRLVIPTLSKNSYVTSHFYLKLLR